jgi:FkbM family methyltransferase
MDKDVYYENKYGLAGFERILVTHGYFINQNYTGNIVNPTIVDIGANVGHFSRMAKVLFPNALIYAIEPVPPIFECLLKNTSKYSDVKCFNFAVSSAKKSLRMTLDTTDPALCTIDEKGPISVECTTLDMFCMDNQIRNIDILKIDVESHELEVLVGAKQILPKVHWLWMEITMKHNDGSDNENYTISELMSKLVGDGYNFQIEAYRNFTEKGEGEIPAIDALFINKLYK